MTQYFNAEVLDVEIAEIIAKNLSYWIGLALDEKPKSSIAAMEMVTLFNGMDGLEKDEFLRQIQRSIDTTTIIKGKEYQ